MSNEQFPPEVVESINLDHKCEAEYVVVNERHADIALGLLEVPQHERGGCWHIETEGVLRALVRAAAVKASDALEGSNGT